MPIFLLTRAQRTIRPLRLSAGARRPRPLARCATRSLLNTAKLMEDNPLLVRLKELETLEKVADKAEKITVVGGLNSLLEKTVTIQS
jgi:hypothetical protein